MQIKVKGIIHHQSLLNASSAIKPNGQRYEQKSYSVNILIPVNDPQFQTIQNAVDDAIKSEFPNGQLPQGANNIWKKRDGDLTGFMTLRLATKEEFTRPHVVDMNANPIMSPEDIKVGDYVWVVGETDAYQTGSGGVSCYLNGTMITGEKGNIPMKSLSSTPTAQFMFADVINGGTSPAPAPAPAHQMTASAGGATYEAMIAAGWTDETLIQAGHMLQPVVKPSFM